MSDAFDLDDIQPAMRNTVQWLRAMDLKTTDSGDGITNVAAGMEGALDIPHVFMVSSQALGFMEADLIWGALKRLKIDKKEGVSVEMSYSPDDRIVILALYGVDDMLLSTAQGAREA